MIRAMTAARIRRLQLTNFRSYRAAKLEIGDATWSCWSGRTAPARPISSRRSRFLAPGRGLRRATLDEVAFSEGDGSWAVSAEVEGALGLATLGTGIEPPHDGESATTRQCRIDREPVGSAAAFADHLRVIWLTPAMDGLFAGPASERRRFLDRLVVAVDAEHSQPRVGARAVAALAQPPAGRCRSPTRTGSTRSSTRPPSLRSRSRPCAPKPSSACKASSRKPGRRCRRFPLPRSRSTGWIEQMLLRASGDRDRGPLPRRAAENRARDAAAGRTLDGPHLTDLTVVYGPKNIPAADASTGEQKAVLIRLVLAHCGLLAEMTGFAPVLLLDEVVAHLDPAAARPCSTRSRSSARRSGMTGADPLCLRRNCRPTRRFSRSIRAPFRRQK